MPESPKRAYPLFVPRDLDGLAALLVDNLVNLLIIAVTCIKGIGMSPALVYGRVLPGAAISLVAGNLYYARMAARLARAEGRSDVTALPYGINTVTVFAFLFLIMAPVARATGDPELAWKVGVAACVLSGIIEMLGAFVGDAIRRVTPRAALLAALASIALSFIAMKPSIDIWGNPLVGILPMAIILAAYLGGLRLPFGIPAGFAAIVLGALLGWATGLVDATRIAAAMQGVGFHPPVPTLGAVWQGLAPSLPFLAIIVPTAVMTFVGTLQCVESASAAGDTYKYRPVMIADGVGTILGGLFGSCFPTTVYIGHPGYKAMGARQGYSILNAVLVTVLCLAGLVEPALTVIPIPAVAGILLFIGVVIGVQVFTVSRPAYYSAVILGFVPSIAAWGTTLVDGTLQACGVAEGSVRSALLASGVDLEALRSLGQGSLFTSTILAAAFIGVIDKRWLAAGGWCLAASAASAIGFIHAPTLQWMASPRLALAYAACAVVCLAVHAAGRRRTGNTPEGSTPSAPI